MGCEAAIPPIADCTTTPSTVLIDVKPYCPPGTTADSCTQRQEAVPPPVEGKPVGVPTLPAVAPVVALTPAVSIDPCGDFSTEAACAAYQAANPPAVATVGVARHVPPTATLPATGTPAGMLTLLALGLIILGRGLAKVKR